MSSEESEAVVRRDPRREALRSRHEPRMMTTLKLGTPTRGQPVMAGRVPLAIVTAMLAIMSGHGAAWAGERMLPEFLADMDLPTLSWGMSKRAVARAVPQAVMRKPRCLYPPDITKEECFDIQIQARQYAIMNGTLAFRFAYNKRLTSIVFHGVAKSRQEEGEIIRRFQQLYDVPQPDGIDGLYTNRHWEDVHFNYKSLMVDGNIHYWIDLNNPKDVEYFHEEFLSSKDYDAAMRRQARREARKHGRSKPQ